MKSARGSVAPIAILTFGRSAFGKSGRAAWIRFTVAVISLTVRSATDVEDEASNS